MGVKGRVASREAADIDGGVVESFRFAHAMLGDLFHSSFHFRHSFIMYSLHLTTFAFGKNSSDSCIP